MRNVLSYTPARHKAAVGEGLKRIFRAKTAAEACERCAEFAATMEGKATKAIACLENGIEDALAVMALLAKYRRRMKSTNMQERFIQEVRRRERVVRIFPNEDSALRLVGALLAERSTRNGRSAATSTWASSTSGSPNDRRMNHRTTRPK